LNMPMMTKEQSEQLDKLIAGEWAFTLTRILSLDCIWSGQRQPTLRAFSVLIISRKETKINDKNLLIYRFI
jgi:hypothetical protein